MKHLFPIRPLLTLAAMLAIALAMRADEVPEDELARRASWTIPDTEQVQEKLTLWLSNFHPTFDPQKEFSEFRSRVKTDSGPELLEHVAKTIALVDPQASELVDFCGNTTTQDQPPAFTILSTDNPSDFVLHNLRLYYARWLIEQRLLNEAHHQLSGLKPSDVVAPATLLFYQSVVAHHLIDKQECTRTIDQLLEHESSLPRRYVEVARLMRTDIEALKKESLDEISRMMRNVRIRLDLGRAGKRVQTEEEEILEKLKQKIDQLEQQQQQSQSGAGGGSSPQSPAGDSYEGGGSAPGDVDPKSLSKKAGWGNLPPKQRQEALQQVSRDFPTHYRDVIEAYFKKIARDDIRP